MYYQAFQRGQGFLQGMLGGLAGICEDDLFLSNMHEFLDLKRLARAFVRDSQILVLDEPSSSMDAKAEDAVSQNVRTLTSGRTAILISHRFSTVRMADRIYVLNEGRIVEGGTHEELVHSGGTYAHLSATQARQYR